MNGACILQCWIKILILRLTMYYILIFRMLYMTLYIPGCMPAVFLVEINL